MKKCPVRMACKGIAVESSTLFISAAGIVSEKDLLY